MEINTEPSYNEISPKFRLRLIEIIDDLGYSNFQFASFSGVSKDIIARATKYGIIPSLRTLIKIADAVNCSIDYLLGETDNQFFYKADEKADFQSRIEELLKSASTKYSKVAHTMPFPGNFFYDWKRRKLIPSLGNLQALADYFKVSKDYLLGRTDERD